MSMVMSSTKGLTILSTGLLEHHGLAGLRVSPGVTVNAAGSDGSSGSRMCLDSFFSRRASCWGLEMCVWCCNEQIKRIKTVRARLHYVTQPCDVRHMTV